MKLYSEHQKHLVAVDCIIFGYDITAREIKLLLVKRSFEPAYGKWSLAGGFVMGNESLDDAVNRVLFRLTGLKDIYMEQSYTYGETGRDPGARVISAAYSALIKLQDLDEKLKEKNGAHWHSLSNLPDLVFDHRSMVDRALNDLQFRIKIKPVGFELLPEKFTLVQLQDLYEAILRRQIDRRNFRKKIMSMNILEKLEEKEKETSKKGAFYYTFNRNQYDLHRTHGFYFSPDVK